MFEYLSSTDVYVIDKNCEFLGISRRILIENVGREVCNYIIKNFPNIKKVLVLVGPGYNGCDGLATAKYLLNHDLDIKVITLFKLRDVKLPEMYELVNYLKMFNVDVYECSNKIELLSISNLITQWPEIIIDAIFGVGFKGILTELYSTAIELVNLSSAKKISIDVPSGLNSDTGEVLDKAVKADITLTIHKPKIGFTKENAREYVGEVLSLIHI